MNLGLPVDEVQSRVEQAIQDLEITPFRDKPTHFLSGGQKKQVSIADILVMNPDVIVLDEPAAALDPKHTVIVNHLIDKLSERGITTIISTHDVNHAYDWADDVVLFLDGRVLLSGSPEEVFPMMRHYIRQIWKNRRHYGFLRIYVKKEFLIILCHFPGP